MVACLKRIRCLHFYIINNRKKNNTCKSNNKKEKKETMREKKSFSVKYIFPNSLKVWFAAYFSKFTLKWQGNLLRFGTLFNIRQEKKYCFIDNLIKLITFFMTSRWKFTKYYIEHIKSSSFTCRSVNMKTQFTP